MWINPNFYAVGFQYGAMLAISHLLITIIHCFLEMNFTISRINRPHTAILCQHANNYLSGGVGVFRIFSSQSIVLIRGMMLLLRWTIYDTETIVMLTEHLNNFYEPV